ncbi:replicative DNA helicase [Mesoflavibacter profundi]|uniref:replicative DNA helicase n=1 Tax=Mesoflavibacter profundi TaxID=2708110 RepID=UPI003518CA14
MQSKELDILDKGLLPPQATDIEKVVLGSMLVSVSAVDELMVLFQNPDVFYDENHQYIFSAMLNLYNKGIGIDLITVSTELKSIGKLEVVGGDYQLIQLSNKVGSAAHIEYHGRILMQYYLKRKLIMLNSAITAKAYLEETDVFRLIDDWQKGFDSVVDLTSKGRNTMTIDKALIELRNNIEVISAKTEDVKMIGVPTGFRRTDIHTGGYRNQNLIILAARPGMGKTSKVLKTIVENVKIDNPVGMISLEMSMMELTARVVAIDTNFHLKQLLKTGFEKTGYFQTYNEHSDRISKYKLIVDDSGDSDITDIVITAKMWKRVYGIKLLVVDYLQLMKDRSVKGNREAEISSISRRLKLLAKELDIPVIALSQLSRAVETRGGSKRPLLSDLRDSGAIEQDADIVEFIYRPDYYGIDIEPSQYDSPVQQRCVDLGANSEIIFAKYRGGSLGTSLLKWIGDKTKFIDVEDETETVEYIDNKNIPLGNPNTVFDAD